MADPLSILSIIESSLSLILQCGNVAKTLNDLAGKFKQAKLALLSMAQEVDTIELAWSRIRQWSENCEQNQLDLPFVERLDRSLECGTLVISALQQDLAACTSDPHGSSVKQRAKLTWNEKALRDHQDRISRQAIAMSLLLQAINLPTFTQRKKLLRAQERRLFESDESAWSIVPSRLSSRLSLSTYTSINSTELLHSRLACEDDLFTARAYKRHIKSLLVKSARSKLQLSKFEDGGYDKLLPEKSPPKKGQNLNGRKESQDVSIPSRIWSLEAKECTSYLPSSIEVRKIFEKTQDIDRAFIEAARVGCLVDIKGLESIGAEISKTSVVNRWTPLHHAAAGGKAAHYGVAAFLIKHGAKVTSSTKDGLQPIHLACESASADLVRLLLNTGASPHCRSQTGLRPLHFACKHPDGSDTMKLLVERGADKDAESGVGGAHGARTALQMACCLIGNSRTVQSLLDLGANPDAGSEFAYSLLDFAILGKFPAVARFLLQQGADPNMRNSVTSETCLQLCIKGLCKSDSRGRNSMHMLLDFGAKAGAVDDTGNNVLHCLAKGVLSKANRGKASTPPSTLALCFAPVSQWPEWIRLIEKLVQHGADPTAVNHDGDSPQTLAIQQKNFPYFNLLYEHSIGNLSTDRRVHLRRLLIENVDEVALRKMVAPRSTLAPREIAKTRMILDLLSNDARYERSLSEAERGNLWKFYVSPFRSTGEVSEFVHTDHEINHALDPSVHHKGSRSRTETI